MRDDRNYLRRGRICCPSVTGDAHTENCAYQDLQATTVSGASTPSSAATPGSYMRPTVKENPPPPPEALGVIGSRVDDADILGDNNPCHPRNGGIAGVRPSDFRGGLLPWGSSCGCLTPEDCDRGPDCAHRPVG